MKISIPIIRSECTSRLIPGYSCEVVRLRDIPRKLRSELRVFLAANFGGHDGKGGIIRVHGVQGDVALIGNVHAFFANKKFSLIKFVGHKFVAEESS